MKLDLLGWNPFFAEAMTAQPAGLCAGRVASGNRGIYRTWSENGEAAVRLRGAFRRAEASELPVAGDWAAVDPEQGMIHAVLPRRTQISRKKAGRATEKQVLAANVDVLFVVTAFDDDFNPRRLERYLLMAVEGGCSPVIVINKLDICDDPLPFLRRTDQIAQGTAGLETPVLLVSALEEQAAAALNRFVGPGQTAALVGSSGVGKSTIVNRLLGFERQPVRGVREHDSRGRHTTTARELFLLEQGWLLIDTPGLRELEPWGEVNTVSTVFSEIDALAAACRYRDCRHEGEPGCMVTSALREGTLAEERMESFRKLRRELEHQNRLQDERMAAEHKRKVKQIHRAMREKPPG